MQIGKAVPKPKPKPVGNQPSASELLSAIHQQQQQVLAMYHKESMTARVARAVHDIGLVCTIFGHLPPIRLSCIRSLMVPSYAGTCLNPDCKLGSTCHGNQLQNTAEHGLHMHLPHHKNERNWSRAAISFSLPQELTKLLKLHLSKGWKLLTEYNGAEDACHVFIDFQGRPFSSSNFSIYWNRLLQAMSIPCMPPKQCRQIFVAERRSEDRVAGPAERGAAMVMGHSVEQWDKWYDTSFHARHAQQAVDAMAPWRQALLSQPAQPQPLPAQPQLVSASPPLRAQTTATPHSLPRASPLLAMLSPSHILPIASHDDDEFYVDISE